LNLNLLIEGVEKLDKGDGTGKLTVTGTIDAAKLRDKIVSKTKKKVEVISPILKNNDKENKKSDTKNNKPHEKKPKEVVIEICNVNVISSVLLFTFFSFNI
jgi:hypothetical protein